MKTKATMSQMARVLGVSATAVRKAIQTGRIPSTLVGERELSTGRSVPVILDAQAAAAAFSGRQPAMSASRADVRQREQAPTAVPSLAESREAREHYRAQIAKLEFEERAGKLVDAEEFRDRFATMIVTVRTRLLGVPSKAKGRIQHLTVGEIEVLDELIREALDSVPEAVDRVQALVDEIRAHFHPDGLDRLAVAAGMAGEVSL